MIGTPAGILVLRTFKAEQLEQLLGAEVWDESIIQRALPTFEMVLRNILSQTEIARTAFDDKLAVILTPNLKDIAMTLAEQIRQEGCEEGLQKGRQEGRQEGLWIGRIQALEEFLSLPSSSRETLEALTVKELESVHHRLRTEYEERFKRP